MMDDHVKLTQERYRKYQAYEDAYTEAMEAANALGYAGMSLKEVIEDLATRAK